MSALFKGAVAWLTETKKADRTSVHLCLLVVNVAEAPLYPTLLLNPSTTTIRCELQDEQ